MTKHLTFSFLFLVLSVLMLSQVCFAQQDSTNRHKVVFDTIPREPWNNEAILGLSYANGGIAFGLVYKRQVAKARFFRLSLADVSFNRRDNDPFYSNQFPTQTVNASLNLTAGVEWRFKLHNRVWTYTGIDVLGGARFYANHVDNPSLPGNRKIRKDYTIVTGLAFNSGIIFEVHELIKIGLNVSPDVFYQFSPWEYFDANGNQLKGESHSVSTSFSSASVQAHIIFRWKRKPFKLRKVKG